MPVAFVPALATTAPDVVIEISPEPVFVMSMPVPANAVTTPFVVRLVFPVPEFSSRIPSPEPVTALAVTSTVVP